MLCIFLLRSLTRFLFTLSISLSRVKSTSSLIRMFCFKFTSLNLLFSLLVSLASSSYIGSHRCTLRSDFSSLKLPFFLFYFIFIKLDVWVVSIYRILVRARSYCGTVSVCMCECVCDTPVNINMFFFFINKQRFLVFV